MPYELPPGFVEDLNELGYLIRRYDNPRSPDTRGVPVLDTKAVAGTRRDMMLGATSVSCRMLLSVSNSDFSKGLMELEERDKDYGVFDSRETYADFLGTIEDMILRDFGVDRLTRMQMLSEVRHLYDQARNHAVKVDHSVVLSVLERLTTQVCERSEKLQDNQKWRLVRHNLVFSLAPINTAALWILPDLAPGLLHASKVVGTVGGGMLRIFEDDMWKY